ADVSTVLEAARAAVATEPELVVDYLDLVDARSWEPVGVLPCEGVIIAAVRAGRTRLLDAEWLG
ncbi:MAG TPA: hypothetical protein VK139_06975, partial [Microbacteriaceae bacterium]|nr:hypothetical protein [Microbacteriaceae bacterium]